MRKFSAALRQVFLELMPAYIGTARSRMEQQPLALKSDGTPAGELDILTMKKLRECIARHFPHDLIVGEEDETDCETIQRILADHEGTHWTVDGLDGTQNWELGTTFGGMVARRKGNEILYAAVFQPMDEHVYGAGFFEAEKGYGAWRWYDEETHIQIFAAKEGALKRPLVMIEGSSKKSFKNARAVNLGQRVSTRTNVSSCFSTTIIANGQASGMLVIENPPWDTWPALLFIPEAGGIVTDWDGNPVTPANCGKIIAAGNETDHAMFLEFLTP